MVPPISHKVPRVSWYSGSCRCLPVSNTRLSLSLAGFPKTILLPFSSLMQSMTPRCTHHGLGSFPFARRYSENRCFFLFLRLLRCFSSPGSLCMAMYSPHSDWGLLSRVSPFGNLRVSGYLLLTAAYRSLSRPSSALSAKASTLRPYQLDHLFKRSSSDSPVSCIALQLLVCCFSSLLIQSWIDWLNFLSLRLDVWLITFVIIMFFDIQFSRYNVCYRLFWLMNQSFIIRSISYHKSLIQRFSFF